VGNLSDVTPPSDRVAALGMDGHWGRAEEPLHWLVDSPDPVHSGKASDREARSKTQHRTRTKGAGLGLPFGVVMAATTNVPVGLVACAHGGTSLEQWDPAKKGEGGNSLYGSMLRQVGLAGGKVRGVLWYQGESDAMGGAAADYARNFTNFIAAVRDDLGQAELPFYYVQIGRFIFDRESKGWNLVQDVQRQIPDRVPNTAVVASVDLELDDLIHIGTQGQKRLGTRLARIAQRELFGQAGATTPTLDRVTKSGNNLVLKFKGVNRAPSAAAARGRVPANQLGLGGNMAMGGMGAMGGGPRGGFPGMGGDVQLSAAAIGPTSAQPLEGLRPERHIAGFSLRKEDGTEIPLIHDAAVGQSKDTVILRLVTRAPEGARLWYGYGLDPYCNLTDALDMGVPVFGPVSLDDLK
jgi:sialate O-acetylesterase